MSYYDIQRAILNEAQSIEDVYTILDGLTKEDWSTLLAEKQRLDALAEEEYQSKMFRCGSCSAYFQRRELATVPGWHIEAQCKECTKKIWENHSYTCLVCGQKYVSVNAHAQDMEICIPCEQQNSYLKRIRSQHSRAYIAGNEATLTIKEWLNACNYFNSKCAYCRVKAGHIEHYLPISLGGGTTALNCIPACGRCNRIKKDKHPDEFGRMFPTENIARIKAYFASLSNPIEL
jgi:5-methylcytosine-specific restriction endonuclease McrA